MGWRVRLWVKDLLGVCKTYSKKRKKKIVLVMKLTHIILYLGGHILNNNVACNTFVIVSYITSPTQCCTAAVTCSIVQVMSSVPIAIVWMYKVNG